MIVVIKINNSTVFYCPYTFWDEREDHVKSLWPLSAGRHMCYNGYFNKMKLKCEQSQIIKAILSLNCRLKLICMKMESRVIVYHYVTVNQLMSQVHTARQAIGMGGR